MPLVGVVDPICLDGTLLLQPLHVAVDDLLLAACVERDRELRAFDRGNGAFTELRVGYAISDSKGGEFNKPRLGYCLRERLLAPAVDVSYGPSCRFLREAWRFHLLCFSECSSRAPWRRESRRSVSAAGKLRSLALRGLSPEIAKGRRKSNEGCPGHRRLFSGDRPPFDPRTGSRAQCESR